jgi:hypothetical protein
MERTLTLALTTVLVCVLAVAGLFIVHNPLNAERKALRAQLASIKPSERDLKAADADINALQKRLAEKPGLWEQLLPPPEPPKPPPPAPPKLEELVKDISFGRQQVGSKVKVTKPGDAKGSFLGVGDTVNGLTIKEISKTAVVLSMEWQGQELTCTKDRK